MTETQMLVINADLPDIDHPLAIGTAIHRIAV